MPRYSFKCTTVAEYRDKLTVYEDAIPVGEFKLDSKIVRNFVLDHLTKWIGKDNAVNIMLRGEEVILIREQPIFFDFSRFKPK